MGMVGVGAMKLILVLSILFAPICLANTVTGMDGTGAYLYGYSPLGDLYGNFAGVGDTDGYFPGTWQNCYGTCVDNPRPNPAPNASGCQFDCYVPPTNPTNPNDSTMTPEPACIQYIIAIGLGVLTGELLGKWMARRRER